MTPNDCRSKDTTTTPAARTGKRELWLRLKHYHFEHLVPAHLSDHVMAAFGGPDAATRAFAGKLARKLGWTPVYARRAVEEYRKFVYLGMVSDSVVTPSKIIDQVWHEHLLFTAAYRQFCGEVLRRDFDHHPELASIGDQTEQFRSQFESTVALYETEFNTAPPPDIWGVTKFRPGLERVKHVLAGKRGTASADATSYGDTPLYLWFDGSAGSGGASHESMPEFGGGGGFSGSGGGDSWGDSHSGPASGDSASDGGGGDHGTNSGSDSSSSSSSDGGSDSGGSSCSSSCGGGGCGGGGE